MKNESHLNSQNGHLDAPSDEVVYDAAIVGAGLAGSAMAAALAQRGWQVLLIERDTFPRHKVCGEFLSPEAQVSLQGLGLYEPVASLNPEHLKEVAMFSLHGSQLVRPLPATAWGISRYALDETLARTATAHGTTLWTGATAQGWQRQDEQYRLQVRRQDETVNIRARALFMAVGRNGSPRLSPSQRNRRRTSRRQEHHYVGVKCHYAGVPFKPQVELYFFKGGYAGLNAIEAGKANLCVMVSYKEFARAGRSITGVLEHVVADHSQLQMRLAGATQIAGTDCAVAPVITAQRSRPWDGVANLGDAAVMLPPLCGDGMAMALRSAELCVPLAHAYLRQEISLSAWASEYRHLWKAEFDRRVRIGRWMQRLLRKPRLADALLTTGTLFPAWADYFVSETRGEV